jgi:hypothetical protein
MPISLTTPFDPGDHAPGQTYSKAKIILINIDLDSRKLDILVDFGEAVGDQWQRGVGAKKRRFFIKDSESSPDFSNLMGRATLEGESLHEAVKRVAYAYIQTVDASLSGTVF